MAKKLFLFFYFIFLTSLVSSATLSMGPSQLDFVGDKNENICQSATLKGDSDLIVIGETRWAEKGYDERKLTRHIFTNNDLGLRVNIPSEVNFEGETEIEVCVSGKKGSYHGILLYKIKDKPIQVGIWLNVSIGGPTGSGNDKITGNAVRSESSSVSGFFIVPLILLGILAILLLRLKFKE